MRKITKPTLLCEEVFNTCISKVRKPSLKTKLNNAVPFIKNASDEFDKKVTTGKLHTIAREQIVNGNVSRKELEGVYTNRLAGINGPGRTIYNNIILSAILGRCPLCGHGDATTVDHYLPKTKYPRLSTAPLNLIPCCSRCNDIKDAFHPTKDFEEFMHPYYDDIDVDSWLNATIVQSSPCSFHFFADPPANWPELLKNRLKFHFKKLELGKLYTSQAAVEVAMLRHRLYDLEKAGPDAIVTHLQDEEKSRKAYNSNSWQAVFYRTAMNDKWFCSGGFK